MPFFADDCLTVDGPSNGTTCVFPFTLGGVTYKACSMFTLARPICSTMVDDNGVHIGGQGYWGYCDPECPCDGSECPFKESDEGKPEQIYSPI